MVTVEVVAQIVVMMVATTVRLVMMVMKLKGKMVVKMM